MIIQKKRINSINKYINQLGDIRKFYICVKNSPENFNILKNIDIDIVQGMQLIPPVIGPITKYNYNGKKVVRKDLEKEVRCIERDYHIVDWHGDDHYGTCYQNKMCYPIDILLPPCEKLIIDERVIRSGVLLKEERERIKHVINMFLEIFGLCEIMNIELEPISSNIIRRISWKILPPGKYPWNKAQKHLEDYFKSVSQNRILTIQKRHQILSNYEPDFIAIGEEGFKGYVVYGYVEKDLYYFESNEVNNATYIFKGKWEEASKLTKRDIISGNLCYKRLVHTQNWEKNIAQIMERKEMTKESELYTVNDRK